MGDHSESIEKMVKKLPPEYQEEVRSRRTLKFDWSGTLKELRDQYTSMELQHKVSKWRI
jgi:hypothetical protein